MDKRVVITGVGAVTPVGNNVADFWESLKEGRSGIGYITKFDTANFKVKIGAEVKNLDFSDYLTPPEIRRNDEYTRFALIAAAEAVADSKIEGTIEPERLGVYVGSGIGGIGTLISEYDRLNEKGKVSPFLIPMMIGNIASGTIAIKYGATGVNLPVVTACSTGANAIGEAYRAIKHGYADAIIAGGSESAVNRLAVAGFTSCTALSQSPDPETACRPFDKERDGFIIGEGAGILVLEELGRATMRGAKIYGEITGYSNTCDAFHITAPHSEGAGAKQMFTDLARQANYDGEEAVYVNAHGTSTPLNDKIETLALKSSFGQNAYKMQISSTKSMTGHLLGATGAVEAIASLLALESGILPPTIGYKNKDEECDLDYIPNTARQESCSLALSVSLGFGGHNAGLAFRRFEK